MVHKWYTVNAFYCVWWCATFLAAHGGVKDATPPPPVNPLYANAVKKRNFCDAI